MLYCHLKWNSRIYKVQNVRVWWIWIMLNNMENAFLFSSTQLRDLTMHTLFRFNLCAYSRIRDSGSYPWLCARLQYLQCVSNGDVQSCTKPSICNLNYCNGAQSSHPALWEPLAVSKAHGRLGSAPKTMLYHDNRRRLTVDDFRYRFSVKQFAAFVL